MNVPTVPCGKNRRPASLLRAAAIAVLLLAGSVGKAQQTPPVAPRVDARHLRMPDPGLDFPGQTFNVAGDPSKPGIYVIRRRFKPGEMTHPHIHNQDRFVTVMKGTWWTGEGDLFEPAKTIPIKTGGFMLHPTGLHHYDGAKDEEVIVQIVGMGPVTTTYTEVDPSGKPVPQRP